MTIISFTDLAITVAYFSIPFQILFGLCRFPRVTRRATKRVVILLVLFALFIFLCGFGHLLRCVGMGDTPFFRGVNIATAVISISTAAYLMPFVPTLLDGADKLYLEATTSKQIIEKLYPEQIRQRLLRRSSADVQHAVGLVEFGRKHSRLGGGGGYARKDQRALIRRMIQDFLRRRSSNDRSGGTLDDAKDINSSSSSDEESPNGTNHHLTTTLRTTSFNPIADDFDQASIMFADISNFTYWSSQHSPIEVFTLLESVFFEFDRIAAEMGVYKVSTVGDCYIAVTGVPCPAEDHAIILTQFAKQCRRKANQVLFQLNPTLDTSNLNLRIGIHSGPVTAGVLRGDKARFDLFGDTINTAARIESTGKPNYIHLSEETARLLELGGVGDWLLPRKDAVKAKGKGLLKTFWLREDDDDGNGAENTINVV